ncbi:MAG: tRNA (adenosine(37)-N6)-threonylcarbamoyltransferase complex transferase subunit TsaD [Dehalococcoidia bacterium]|nr:tRNA (adenosine(37)-N6)-threonylcarbamoyltransferase complex transferase subunit TsaD [Dehalococcoidia bacterium]
MKILSIETSCDETAVAVVEDGTRMLSNVVSSQIDIHRRYGGIVPEVASRQHMLSIVPVYEEALQSAGLVLQDMDRIAVTYGPGLAGSLLVGVNFAKAVAIAAGIPLFGVNHMEAHVYANWLAFPIDATDTSRFPCLCLIVSGGHTELQLMTGHGQYQLVGHTRDDAAGEAFDKAARLLNLGYPGGPVIEQAARRATGSLALPRAWLKGTYDFSFSGLKTALWHAVNKQQIVDDPELTANAAAGFQEAVVDVLVQKTLTAAMDHGAVCILVSGGVAANSRLRERLTQESPITVLAPPLSFCTDNAAMVGACSYFSGTPSSPGGPELDVLPGLSL